MPIAYVCMKYGIDTKCLHHINPCSYKRRSIHTQKKGSRFGSEFLGGTYNRKKMTGETFG